MSQLVRIVANLSGQVKHITHDGRDYLVAPAVAIKAPAVLNGELVLPEEVAKYVEAWNGISLPVYHPKDSAGNFISANTPELEAKALGRFYNASFKDGKLHGELWVDTERAKALGGEALTALERLETGQPLELSTGYFRDLEETAGIHEGIAYSAIARNLRPNHLALLPNEIGACSWADGCGAPRVNQKGVGMEEKRVMVNLELTLTDQDMKVYDAWYNNHYVGRIINVYAERVDVSRQDGLWAYPYTISEEGMVVFGEPTQYQLVTANTGFIKSLVAPIVQALKLNSKEVQQVNKKDDLIAKLVANQRCKLGQATLQKLDESELQALTDQMAEQAPTPASQPAQEAPVQPAPTPIQPTQAQSEEPPAWAKSLLSEWGELKATLKTNTDQERAALLEELAANQQALPKAALEKLSTDELRGYARTFIPVDYSGRGVLIGNRQAGGGDWEDYDVPEMAQNGTGK
jgi:hypothetical protein